MKIENTNHVVLKCKLKYTLTYNALWGCKYNSNKILIQFYFILQRQPMIGRKLVFDNESLPDTYNESPLPQSPDANELFAQWDSPMQSPAADMHDGGGHARGMQDIMHDR